VTDLGGGTPGGEVKPVPSAWTTRRTTWEPLRASTHSVLDVSRDCEDDETEASEDDAGS
jgi:hypothetical protein